MKSNAEILMDYKKMLDEEIITPEEFEKKKYELLNQPEVETNTSVNQATSVSHNVVEETNPSMGWGILGALIPIVGLILFLVWNNTKPKSAKYAGIGGLIGFIFWLIV